MMEFRKFAFAAGTVLLLTVLLNGEKLDNKNKQEEDVTFVVPSTSDAVFADTFESVDVFNQQNQQFWVKSQVEKYSSQSVAVKKSTELKGVFSQEQGLTLEKPAKHYGIASKLQSPFSLKQNQEVVVQYEVKLTEGLECGGAYIKLLSDTTPALDLTTFDDQTPFTIMFGPDRCGSNNKVHFILRHQSPKTHKYEEKHLKSPPEAKIDRLSHLYTLVLRNSNHSYEIFIDQVSVANGSLFSDFEPAINPPKEIDDPNDKKPADWVDEFKIADPNAKKPDDWDESEPEKIVDESAKKPANWLDDEPLMVKDPKVMKPEDWSDDDDGEWEAPQIANPKCSSGLCGKWEKPMIHNPKYKGIWKAPLISNPRYKGEWKPRKIPNPDYFEDAHPMSNLANIGAVAIEVWTMSGGISFDNFWLGHDASKALDFGKKTWLPKFEAEKKLLSSNIDSGKREKRELLLKSGSLSDKIQVYFMDFMDFVNLHYQASLAVAVGILTSLLALCFLCGRANLPAKDVEIAEKVETEAPGIEDDVEVDQDESRFEEIEEEEKVDEEPKSKVRQRKKKAPKAD